MGATGPMPRGRCAVGAIVEVAVGPRPVCEERVDSALDFERVVGLRRTNQSVIGQVPSARVRLVESLGRVARRRADLHRPWHGRRLENVHPPAHFLRVGFFLFSGSLFLYAPFQPVSTVFFWGGFCGTKKQKIRARLGAR